MTGLSTEFDSTNAASRGLIPRLIEALFAEMHVREQKSAEEGREKIAFTVQAEFVEIYNG